jgi:hypothetical protein
MSFPQHFGARSGSHLSDSSFYVYQSLPMVLEMPVELEMNQIVGAISSVSYHLATDKLWKELKLV